MQRNTPIIVAIAVLSAASGLLAQRNRLGAGIDNTRRVRLEGHLRPQARAAADEGPVDPAMELSSITLVLRPSAGQQAALDQLLAAQQDPASPDYHRWLTPEQYAERFGVSAADIARITDWLGQRNLTVTGVARSRSAIFCRGTAGDAGRAFGTEIHHYTVNGTRHFANATELSIPAALTGMVSGVRGLHDFRLRARSVHAEYTTAGGSHYLSPGDFAVIYNVAPLWAAGINGTGQSIVVAGQSQIRLTDIRLFRATFGLPAADPMVALVPQTADPGIVPGDIDESLLDLEWAGGVAPNASILFVYSKDVMDAVLYSIDQNLAPVLSVSYGLCEVETPRADVLTFQVWARQANAQGMTWLNATGDSGGADCINSSSTSDGVAAVDAPASVPEVTGVGGTTLSEGGGRYWNAANSAAGTSATSYIPEVVWNDSTSQNPSATGGGASQYFAKPSWQAGTGVPDDKARDVPDVALAASAQHDGYLIVSNAKTLSIGGTSAATPAFAGIVALLNQYLVTSGLRASAGLGNINPKLYAMAQSTPGVFHDIVTGDNIVTVTCGARARNCVSASYGFQAGPGYDQATGLGSVDAFQLAAAWNTVTVPQAKLTPALGLAVSATAAAPSDKVTLTATLGGSGGQTPQGSVTFSGAGSTLGSANLAGSGGTASAVFSFNGSALPVGDITITAQYDGDSTFGPAIASVTLSVHAVLSVAVPAITGLTDGAAFREAYAPGMILSVFGTGLAPFVSIATNVPLPLKMAGVSATVNGVAAPLYYVSAGQLNLQIPYETALGTARLVVTDNGASATGSFTVTATAPGLFTDITGTLVPNGSASRGQVITLFLTGQGAVAPAVATGAAPSGSSNLPAPVQSAQVTVGGVRAAIQFIGIPPGLAGVTQINYQVPANAPVGKQPVVVTIGGVASQTGTLTVR